MKNNYSNSCRDNTSSINFSNANLRIIQRNIRNASANTFYPLLLEI